MEVKKGDKVKVKVRRYNQFIDIVGVVKDIKSTYGRNEYLLTDTSTKDFWVRTIEKNG